MREIARAGRLYKTGQQFQVTAGNVVYIGFAEIVLGDEDKSAYGYEYRLDATVSMASFGRHPELGKLINAWVPASFFTNDNVSLFAPTYAVPSAEVKEPKTLGAPAEHGDLATARELLQAGVDLNAPDADGWAPLHSALRFGHKEIAELLLDRGASPSVVNPDGWTPLMIALKAGPAALATRMIQKGADVESKAKDGWTPLMLAVRNDQAANARLLIEKGVDLEARNKDGWTPLMFALRYGQAECARLLVAKSKRIDEKNKDGWTALMLALRNGQADAAEALLKRGAAFDYKVEGGWDCLLTALRNGQPENARRLILKGANVDARTAQGWTALMLAIEYDQAENARLLIEKGADATARNADGATALSLAKKKGLFEISRLLGDTEPGPSAFVPATSGAALPGAIAAAAKLPAGTTVVSASDCSPGLNGVAQCVVTIEAAGSRTELYDSLAGSLKGAGWVFDKGTHAKTEDATVPGGGWGFLGLKKKQADGLAMLVITFPTGAPPAANGRTRVDVGYQVFPHELKRVTYSQVLASYPSEAKQCGTRIDVTGVSPSGEWRTMGIVDYVNFKPQLQCLGTRVTLKISLAVGGVQYDAGTLLTVDKDQKWIAVTSWD